MGRYKSTCKRMNGGDLIDLGLLCRYTVAQQQVLAPFGKEFTWDLKAKMM